MIGYVTLGTNDLDRAAQFYDALLAEIGATRLMQDERYIYWSLSTQQPGLCLIKPFDDNPATVGNGVMVALQVDSPEKVHAVYHKALELGAQDEGEPGPRGDGSLYLGYFRDLDGNKLNAFCLNPT